jgi:hypothetical protein
MTTTTTVSGQWLLEEPAVAVGVRESGGPSNHQAETILKKGSSEGMNIKIVVVAVYNIYRYIYIYI